MQIRKAFKYRIYPDSEQQAELAIQFGCVRFVYNHYRAVREEYYHETGTGLNYNDCATDLTDQLKVEYPWLKTADSQALQQALKDLDRAYANFFEGRADYPNFKRKFSVQSLRYPQRFKFKGNHIYLPKVGWVKIVRHRRIEGTHAQGVGWKMKNCTVSKTKTGKYFVSIQCEIETDTSTPPTEAVGIDLGIKTFAVLSDGPPIESPKHLRKAERLLKIRQRRLSRKAKGSIGRAKARHVVATIHEKIGNQRKDFHHKESRKIVDRFGIIGLETLNVRGMVKNHNLAKSISDAGWSQFVQFLTYKTAWSGGEIVKHDRWFASSKLCHVCGEKNNSLVLSDRIWTCPQCGTIHDRDRNAAMNLKPSASSTCASTVGATESNAGGHMSSAVRRSAPEKFKAVALEAQRL